MKSFFDNELVQRFGYGMAVYIAAKASRMQRSIDSINMERRATGHHLLENTTIDEVISVLRQRGKLPV